MEEVVCKKFDHNVQLSEQRELFVDCFPENLGTKTIEREHYLWKFHSFPAEKKSSEYIASIRNDMIGYYAAIPYRYQIGEKTVDVAMVCDVMTSSKYRGKGIFTKLGRYSTSQFAKEGYAFSTGFPIRKEVLPGHKKVGWNIAFDMPLYMKFLSMNSFLKERKMGYLIWPANLFIMLFNFLCYKKNKKDYSIKLYHKINDVDGYEEFEEQWRKGVKNVLIKDKNFANWRYSAPDKKYLFLCAYKANKMVGFLSARAIVKEGVPSLGVLDIMVLSNEKGCLNNIYNSLFKIAKGHHIEAVMLMMSRSEAKKYMLPSHAFLQSPFIFHFIIKKYDDAISDSDLFDVHNWHLMFVDSDDL